jgi:hypothetical protein
LTFLQFVFFGKASKIKNFAYVAILSLNNIFSTIKASLKCQGTVINLGFFSLEYPPPYFEASSAVVQKERESDAKEKSGSLWRREKRLFRTCSALKHLHSSLRGFFGPKTVFY